MQQRNNIMCYRQCRGVLSFVAESIMCRWYLSNQNNCKFLRLIVHNLECFRPFIKKWMSDVTYMVTSNISQKTQWLNSYESYTIFHYFWGSYQLPYIHIYFIKPYTSLQSHLFQFQRRCSPIYFHRLFFFNKFFQFFKLKA